jgi:hypothetical protein
VPERRDCCLASSLGQSYMVGVLKLEKSQGPCMDALSEGREERGGKRCPLN